MRILFIIIMAATLQACEGISPKHYIRYSYIKLRGKIKCDIRDSNKTVFKERDGKYIGKYIAYDSLGCLKVKGRYKDGLPHGMWEYYSFNGWLVKVRFYKNGKGKRIELYNVDW